MTGFRRRDHPPKRSPARLQGAAPQTRHGVGLWLDDPMAPIGPELRKVDRRLTCPDRRHHGRKTPGPKGPPLIVENDSNN